MSLDEPIDGLYDEIRDLHRKVLGIERSFRGFAERDDIAVAATTSGDEATAGEVLARVVESLDALRTTLEVAEIRRADAKEAASRLYIDRGV